MFLSAEDMKALTGYGYSQLQVNWLKSHGWRYELSRSGRPVVLSKHAEEMMMLGTQQRQAPKMNLAAIKRAA